MHKFYNFRFFRPENQKETDSKNFKISALFRVQQNQKSEIHLFFFSLEDMRKKNVRMDNFSITSGTTDPKI